MKKEYKYYIGIGAAILLVGIALQIFWSGMDTNIWYTRITSALRTVGIVLILLGVVRHMIYKEEPEEDERIKKINALTLSYSWTVTRVLVGVLLLLDKWGYIENDCHASSWANNVCDDCGCSSIRVVSQKERGCVKR